VKKAFDLYYDFDYDLGVRDMQDIEAYLKKIPECSGKVGRGRLLPGRQAVLPDVLPHRHRCAVAYYGTYIEHRIREARNLPGPSCCTWR